MTIRRRLFLAMAGLIALMGLIFALLTLTVVRGVIIHIPIADRSEEVRAIAEQAANAYAEHGNSWLRASQDRRLEAAILGERQDSSVLLVSADGSVVLHAGDESAGMIRRFGVHERVERDGVRIGDLYYYDEEAARLKIIQLGVGDSVTILLLASVAVVGLIALAAAWRMARRLTEPIHTLMPAIERLGAGELGVQAPAATRDEYGRLAEAFNAMSTQLKRYETARRNQTADIAHELRTPLAIMRGQLEELQLRGEAVRPETLLPLQDELIRLTRLVDDLHHLSLAEANKLRLDRKRIDLADLLRRVADRAGTEAAARGIGIRVDAAPDLPDAHVDPHRMTQVFLNIVMNAVRHSPDGGTITIALQGEPAAGGASRMLRATIADEGPGIDPEHLPHIFDRFYRAGDDRSRGTGGMGLGLSIAKAFVQAHGGTIEAESELGAGTRFIVRVPAWTGG
jgi:Signal transduction histidine kinase